MKSSKKCECNIFQRINVKDGILRYLIEIACFFLDLGLIGFLFDFWNLGTLIRYFIGFALILRRISFFCMRFMCPHLSYRPRFSNFSEGLGLFGEGPSDLGSQQTESKVPKQGHEKAIRPKNPFQDKSKIDLGKGSINESSSISTVDENKKDSKRTVRFPKKFSPKEEEGMTAPREEK